MEKAIQFFFSRFHRGIMTRYKPKAKMTYMYTNVQMLLIICYPVNQRQRGMFLSICANSSKLLLFEKSASMEKLRDPSSDPTIDNNLMKDYTDGNKYKDSTFFCGGDKIEVILFLDVANLCNPLGSSKSKHKTNFIYYKLGNLKTEHRSKRFIFSLFQCATRKT